MTSTELCVALVRTTLATTAAWVVAWALLARLRVASTSVHRLAWCLVVMQGWLLVPWTFEIKAPVTSRAMPTSAWAWKEDGATWPRRSTSVAMPPLPAKVPTSERIGAAAIAAWLAGGTMLTTLRLHRYVHVVRSLPLGAPPDRPDWKTEWRRQVQAARIRPSDRVDLRITAGLGPLLCWAPFAYLVLAPRALWSTLTSGERESILRHELAHLRRRDLWKSLAIRVLALPQWFNPLVWLAVRRFDEAGEWACDDVAAQEAPDGRLAFANSLLRAAEFTSAALPGTVAAQGGSLSRRIQRLVTPRFMEESKMKKLLVPALLAALAAVQLVRIKTVAAEDASAVTSSAIVEEVDQRPGQPPALDEFERASRMPYVIEPPDVLSIRIDKLVPKRPREVMIEPGDALAIRVAWSLPEQPFKDAAPVVGEDGAVDFGPRYGRVKVVNLTVEQAEARIQRHFAEFAKDATVSLSLANTFKASSIELAFLVQPDGRVNLGAWGSPYVAGATPADAELIIREKLAAKFDRPKVTVEVHAYNSKVYYVITKTVDGTDSVARMPLPYPLSAETNVGSALKQAVYPQPIDFAAARITFWRPSPRGGGERVYPVAWDPSLGAPTPDTNHPLLPGDRIFVDPAQKTATYYGPRPTPVAPPLYVAPPPVVAQLLEAPAKASPVPPAAPQTNPPSAPEAGSVAFKIAVIEDLKGSMSEFEGLDRDGGVMTGDSRTTLAALRILEKNGLVQRVSSPQLICPVGETGHINIGSAVPNADRLFRKELSIEIEAAPFEGDKSVNIVKVTMQRSTDGQRYDVRTESLVGEGETVVIKANSGPRVKPGQENESQPVRPVYLVVTPTLIK